MKAPQSLRDLMEGAESLVYLEDLSNKKGLLQAINPLAKLVAIVAMIVASLFIFNLSYLLILCIIPIVLAVSSRVPLKHFFVRTAFVTALAALLSIPPIFFAAGTLVWAASLGGLHITITAEGLTNAAVFTVRVWFCVASLISLILSTGFDKMLALLSAMKVPDVVVQLFSLTYRYFFVSVHEAQSVLIAKEARTYVHKKTFNMQALKDLGSVVATLFIRTYERSERVYLAMKARGFEIEKSAKSSLPSFHVYDVVFASALIVTVALFALS
ncbi:MAG: cobalt ECF transporter T component CbiQ [Candidatus Bathyarchaeia archaeon]